MKEKFFYTTNISNMKGRIKMKKLLVLSVFVSMLFCNLLRVDAVDTFELGDDVVATSAYRVKSKKYVGHTYGSFKTIASNVSGAKTNNEVLSANATIFYFLISSINLPSLPA